MQARKSAHFGDCCRQCHVKSFVIPNLGGDCTATFAPQEAHPSQSPTATVPPVHPMKLLNGYFVYFVWSAAAPHQSGRDEALGQHTQFSRSTTHNNPPKCLVLPKCRALAASGRPLAPCRHLPRSSPSERLRRVSLGRITHR